MTFRHHKPIPKGKVVYSDNKMFKNLADVWDVPKYKFMIFVVDGKDFQITNKSKLVCEVRLERNIIGKTSQERESNPKWAGLFWCGFDDPDMKTLIFEVFDNKVCVGEARLALHKIPKEALVDSWVPLKPSNKKHAPQQVYGQVHVRYVFSAIPETRPVKPEDQIKMEYFYTKNNTVFRPGDLIAYSGTGLLDTCNKLINNSEHSHIGLVVSIPNKLNGADELFVMEMTNNIDKMYDPFSETNNRSGLCLFRLTERLHFFHGGLITHYPLKEPLEPIAITDLADSMKRVHARTENPQLSQTPAAQYIIRNFPFDAKKHLRQFISLSSAKYVSSALVHIAVLEENDIPKTQPEMTVEWMKRQRCWAKPNLLRMPAEALKAAVQTMGRKGGLSKSAPKVTEVLSTPYQETGRKDSLAAPPPVPKKDADEPPPPPPKNVSVPDLNLEVPSIKIAEDEYAKESSQAQRDLEARQRALEEEQALLEKQLLATEEQLKATQARTPRALGEGNSEEGSDNSEVGDSNLLALATAGFDLNDVDLAYLE